jgi:hypothetical protein
MLLRCDGISTSITIKTILAQLGYLETQTTNCSRKQWWREASLRGVEALWRGGTARRHSEKVKSTTHWNAQLKYVVRAQLGREPIGNRVKCAHRGILCFGFVLIPQSPSWRIGPEPCDVYCMAVGRLSYAKDLAVVLHSLRHRCPCSKHYWLFEPLMNFAIHGSNRTYGWYIPSIPSINEKIKSIFN